MLLTGTKKYCTVLYFLSNLEQYRLLTLTYPPLLFTACQDGTVIVHTVRRGQFLRTLKPPGDSCVPAQISELQVGMEGHIVVQTSLEERPNRKVHEYIQYSSYTNTGRNIFKQVSKPEYNSQTLLIPTGQVLHPCLLS